MTTKRELVDMSAKAIAGRLEMMRALYKLMLSLRTIRVEDARPVNPQPHKLPSTDR
jgi:hypothetical protein